MNTEYRDIRRKDKVNSPVFEGFDYNKRNVHHISSYYWAFLVLIGILIIGKYADYNYKENLPKALGNTDLMHHSSAFIADRAWKDLKIITSFGTTRPLGSYSNEVLTVDFLKREISYIKQTANQVQRIELDSQVATGALWLDYKPYGMTSVYRNIQNIVVKLHGKDTSSKSALLVNCHFDTVPGSSGASDDAASCVVMLEVLRVLSRENYLLRHSVIFLFNGAEESGLQASHAFITEHKWAKEVKAFINLESAGSSGREMLFQTGPKNPWLVKVYGSYAPHPNAQAAAEEIFLSGTIPSDTDFRIFRDYGHLPGLDMAYALNGYRYHTKFDHIDYISRESIQHTGDNVLELVRNIAHSLELPNAFEMTDKSMVFFDVLGLFFVSYSEDSATIFNYAVVVASIILPYWFLSRATRGINKKHLRFELFLGFLINMISLVGANAICYAIAYDLDHAKRSMSWFTNSFLLLPTYSVPTIFVECLVHLIFTRNSRAPMSLALKTQARINGCSLFWGILTAAMSLANVRSAYVLMVPLLITLLANVAVAFMGYQNSIRKWLYIQLIGQIFVVLWSTHYFNLITSLFIPISGRSGGIKNPDILIGLVTSTLTIFITSYLTPLIILLKKTKTFLISLILIYLITRFYVIGITHYGFPYKDESNGYPTVQRHYVTHTTRTLYDKEGNVRYTDSGFWFMEMDRNARRTIESLTIPDIPIPQGENILCKNEIFCGLPYLGTRLLHLNGYWVPSLAPLIRDKGVLTLTERKQITPKTHRLNFMLAGSYYMALTIRPKDNVILENWNILEQVPKAIKHNNQKAYFVLITHGLESPPMNITLDFNTVHSDHKKSLADIALTTFHFEYHKEHTPSFAKILTKFPKWTHVVPSVASLTSWTF